MGCKGEKWAIKSDKQNRIKAVKSISSLALGCSSLNLSRCTKQPNTELHVKIKTTSPWGSAGALRCLVSEHPSPQRCPCSSPNPSPCGTGLLTSRFSAPYCRLQLHCNVKGIHKGTAWMRNTNRLKIINLWYPLPTPKSAHHFISVLLEQMGPSGSL